MTIIGNDIIALITGGALENVGTTNAPTISSTPTALDTKMRLKAYQILLKLGKTLAYTLYPDAEYDATTGAQNPGDGVSYNVKSIPPYEYEDKYLSGDLIQRGDMITGIAAYGIEFTPIKGMLVTVDSSPWKVISVKTYYSGEQPCLYILQLRQ